VDGAKEILFYLASQYQDSRDYKSASSCYEFLHGSMLDNVCDYFVVYMKGEKPVLPDKR
jgi:hypothetical protein